MFFSSFLAALVDEHGNQERIDDGDGRRLGGSKDAAHHANHHDQHRQQRPDGFAQLLDEVDDGETFALGIMPLDG